MYQALIYKSSGGRAQAGHPAGERELEADMCCLWRPKAGARSFHIWHGPSFALELHHFDAVVGCGVEQEGRTDNH